MSVEPWIWFICMVFLCQRICQVTGQISERPANFPSGVTIYRGTYQNWSKEITVMNIWIATPKNEDEVLAIVNFAWKNGYKVRAAGYRHGFSPLTIPNGTDSNKTILVDTTQYLTKMEMTILLSQSTNAIKVQAGASMENILLFLEKNGYGMAHVPAPGDITIGGVLAVGAHGNGITGNIETPGLLYGTLSNSIISLKAVVWNETEYVLKTFNRSDPTIRALLIHLGRSFITEVTMLVGKNYNLRCQSFFDITSDELYASPGNVTARDRTFLSLLDKSGRVDALAFGDTGLNWVKVYNVCPIKPFASRKVNGPYNYVFGAYLPEPIPDLYTAIAAGAYNLTPTLAALQHTAARSLTALTLSADIWGPSKNTMLYVKPETLREHASGHVVITKHENVQEVMSIFAEIYGSVQKEFAAMNKYPISGHMETRVTSLDGVSVLENNPYLSPVLPIPGYPQYNLGCWLAITSQTEQPDLYEAMTIIESRIFERFPMNSVETNPIGFARAEWAKGYAYTKDGGWCNATVLTEIIPATYPEWNRAIETLNVCDPHYIFINDFSSKYLVAH